MSDNNGKLAVILPSALTGKINRGGVYIARSQGGGGAIEGGRFSSVANGNREHFRFSKAGASYPNSSYVIVKLKNGTVYSYRISSTSRRTENVRPSRIK